VTCTNRQYREGMDRGESWIAVLHGMADEQLEAFAAELTEEIPAADPVIGEVRDCLHKLRDACRDTP
jgi:hypothetical protein